MQPINTCNLILGLVLALLLVGCRVPERTDESIAVTNRPEPVVVGASIGLELRRAVVESAGGRIGHALYPHAQRATGIDPILTERLREAGLRVIAVPVDQLDDALGSLRTIGSVSQERLGQLHFWTPLLHGPMLEERYISIDSGVVELDPGRLRLLARAYLVPHAHESPDGARADAKLRVELLPQHEQSERRFFAGIVEPRTRTFEDDGLLFRRLRFAVELQDSVALVLVPEDPRTDWSQLPPPPSSDPHVQDSKPGPIDQLPDEPPDASPGAPTRLPPAPRGLGRAGPEELAPRTLGEQMLRIPTQTEYRESGGIAVRHERSVVLVLISHTPRHYRLLP